MTTPTADTALSDHLNDARKHLLHAYVAVDESHRDVVGALINDVDRVLADVTARHLRRS
ncbi:hypothetical protein H7J50_19170 [Mycobacterium intermedium]|uniref:hypothetical protein n=1 Tax=Mycobacterium intermedium TaxID=28445 RepID=UPI0012E9DB50|nr:hypothetical protein [Mycobacterium intermedium]MCV6965914.1 hypothetical protein [Mycobacterium intermedium]